MKALVAMLIAVAAAERLHVPELGEHHRLVTFEKNENPQNVMIVYARVNEHCHFITEGAKPVVDVYWMMDRQRYKPTHPLIKAQIRSRLRVRPVNADEFRLDLTDVRELHVKEPYFVVRSAREGGACTVRARYPSEHGPVVVDRLYSETRKTFVPPFRRLVSVTIDGTDEHGRAVHLKY